MARPVRLEFGGALYHVTSRGDRREAIYEVDVDRERFLDVLGEGLGQFNWCCHAYCLMSNHGRAPSNLGPVTGNIQN